jgi:hypothetical protein
MIEEAIANSFRDAITLVVTPLPDPQAPTTTETQFTLHPLTPIQTKPSGILCDKPPEHKHRNKKLRPQL